MIGSTILTEYVIPDHNPHQHLMDLLQSNPHHHGHVSEHWRDQSGMIHKQFQPQGHFQRIQESHIGQRLQQHQLQRQRCRPRPRTNRGQLQQLCLLRTNPGQAHQHRMDLLQSNALHHGHVSEHCQDQPGMNHKQSQPQGHFQLIQSHIGQRLQQQHQLQRQRCRPRPRTNREQLQ